MSEAKLTISLNADRTAFAPGEELCGWCSILHEEPMSVRAIEISVLWRTVGKGDEDIGVHFFRRYTFQDQTAPQPATAPRQFNTCLPRSPLTYEGAILNIHWCVRVRAFLRGGREVVCEHPFVLAAAKRPEMAVA